MRKYKNVIKPHHLEKLFKVILPTSNVQFNSLPGYLADFNEVFELNKTVLAKLNKLPEV